MLKVLFAGLTALAITAPSLSYGQAPPAGGAPGMLSETASKALIDRRIEVVKAALTLSPEQEKYWPAVEEAVRSRLTARHIRLVHLAERRNGQGQVILSKSFAKGPICWLNEQLD